MHSGCRALLALTCLGLRNAFPGVEGYETALPLRMSLALEATLHTAGKILKLLRESGGLN